MTDIDSIMKQRGKVVALFSVLSFILCMVNPEVTGSVWPAVGLAVGALAAMEAYAVKGTS